MIAPKEILKQISSITAEMISLGLCNSQSFPKLIPCKNGYCEITYSEQTDPSLSLKNIPYTEIYRELVRTKSFNFLMLDGALIQIMYRFKNGTLESHRLAFFPSPDLDIFQNSPEIYESDEIYADIIKQNIVSTPLRFDFDSRDGVFKDIDHPKSHLTIGQYENCRIPVRSPLTPFLFIHFILRNFYNTAYTKYCTKLTKHNRRFKSSISPNESKVLHVSIA